MTRGTERNDGVWAVILAGGRGTRLGRTKALTDLGGRTLLSRITQGFKDAGFEQVIAVLGHDAGNVAKEAAACGARVVMNRGYGAGQTSSVRAGVAALPDHIGGFALHPVDMPVVREDTVRALLKIFRGLEAGKSVLLPRYRGECGHPAFFRAPLRGEFRALADNEPAHIVAWRTPSRVATLDTDDPGVILDIDTPEDLERARLLCAE